MLRSRLLIEWIVILLVATACVAAAGYSGFTRRFDNLLYDGAAAARAAPADDRILIVTIDNYSLARIGKWQWTRDVHAQMIDRLSGAGAKAIAYDVLFVEPAIPADDAALAQAVARSRRVLLPVLYNVPGLNGADYDIFRPISALSNGAAGLGTVNLVFDQDGLVRRAQIETLSKSTRYQHLMELAYRSVTGKSSRAYRRLEPTRRTNDQADDREGDTILIPLREAGSFRRVSFANVLSGEVPDQFLKGKVILVGGTADGMGDTYPVAAAAGSTMSGIEFQANLLNALFSDKYVIRAPLWLSILAGLMPVWLLMLLFLRLRPTTNLITSVAFVAAVVVLSFAGVAFAGFWIPPGPALLGLLLVYPLWGWRRLEALSSFVSRETAAVRLDVGQADASHQSRTGLDSIAAQAAALRSVIGELRGVRRFMSDVVTGFPDAICVVDRDLRITLANTAAADVLGSELDGQHIGAMLGLASPGTNLDSDEMRTKDGRTFLIRKVPLTNDMGEDAGSIIRFADISRLRDADKEREEMLEFLSHDMRAPQAAIITLLEGQKETGGTDAKLWQRVRDNARKTLKLAEDFVQNARLASTELAMEPVPIAGALAEAVDLVWPEANRKKVKITAEGLEDETFIGGDHGALVRAFTNLIDNAVKYGASGGEVFCRIDRATEKEVRCTISDKGPGLPEQRKSDPFARFGARGEAGASGSGLGLAYVKKVVDRHGGTIAWSSEAGQGTTFILSFPISEDDV